LPGQELTPAILAITNSLPKEADICLSQVREATYGFPSAIRFLTLIRLRKNPFLTENDTPIRYRRFSQT